MFPKKLFPLFIFLFVSVLFFSCKKEKKEVFQSFDLEVKFQNGAYQFLWTLTNISSFEEYILVYKVNHFLEKDVLYCFGFFAKKTFDERVSNSGFDKVVISDNQVGSGGGLAIGVQYALTPKLMLGTEAAFYYLNVERKQTTTFENLSQFNTDPEINDSRITQSLLPSSIYIIFHF